MKLYEVTKECKDLEKLTDDFDAQTLADTFEGIKASFNDKAISLIHVVKNMGADVIALDDEINRLASRKKTITNRQDSMKDYLLINMEATGINKIECPIFTISLKKGRDIVQIDDSDKIPTDYLNIKTSVTPMKREILADLKKGEEITGCSIVKSKSSIVIK